MKPHFLHSQCCKSQRNVFHSCLMGPWRLCVIKVKEDPRLSLCCCIGASSLLESCKSGKEMKESQQTNSNIFVGKTVNSDLGKNLSNYSYYQVRYSLCLLFIALYKWEILLNGVKARKKVIVLLGIFANTAWRKAALMAHSPLEKIRDRQKRINGTSLTNSI